MSEDKKKVTEEVVEEIIVEGNLNEEDLDKASGGSGHASGPKADFGGGTIIGTDGRPYPRVILPDSNNN